MLTIGKVLQHKEATAPRKRWCGPVPKLDSFGSAIRTRFIDGSTSGGWAIMTPRNHTLYGRGLGMGKGQEYELNIDGYWYKIGG